MVQAEIDTVWLRNACFGVELQSVVEDGHPFVVAIEIGGVRSVVMVNDRPGPRG